ncbi:sugar phosphate isomerase/epimerase [Paraburkholderia sediminicola]|uniref:TIM barrel protein n=1 Tax=Paraburkholderia sediminicola TaxID=458836 RepID=UPI0038BD490E
MSSRWNLNYTLHLGYLHPDDPLFRESVRSSDPWDHVEFAAQNGFAGVLFPWAVERSAYDVSRFKAALQHFGLRSSCIVYAPLDAVMIPSWTKPDGWVEIQPHLDRTIPLAADIGAPMLAVLLRKDGDESRIVQENAVVENLRRAGDRASAAGLVIGIEHMIALPDMLLTNTEQVVALLDRVGHPAVKLIFDTGHVYEMGDDVNDAYRRARHHIGLIQFADMPGRVEPGSGTIDFESLLKQIQQNGDLDQLIDLEHGWTEHSSAVESAGLLKMRTLDATLDQRQGFL